MSNTKKNLNYAFKFLMSTLIGGIIGVLFASQIGKKMEPFFDAYLTILSTIVTTIIVIIIGICMVSQLKSAKISHQKSELLDDQADDFNKLYNYKLFNAGLLYNVAIIIALLNMIINVMFKLRDNDYWFVTFIPFLIGSVLGICYSTIIPKIEKRLPKFNEPNYIDKLIASMDEGERHISYSALFKLYQYNISALMIIIVVLACYSAMTNSNQVIGLCVLIGLYAFNILFYHSKIRRYYQ